jgi:hypothetical protein
MGLSIQFNFVVETKGEPWFWPGLFNYLKYDLCGNAKMSGMTDASAKNVESEMK